MKIYMRNYLFYEYNQSGTAILYNSQEQIMEGEGLFAPQPRIFECKAPA